MARTHACLLLLALAGTARAEDLDSETSIGAPVSYRNLTVFPLVAKEPARAAEDYAVLDEGLRSGKLKVVEKGEGVVNELRLVNKTGRPLFVMAGEVVLGGKQDRIIGKDQIIGSGQTVDVPVYCVEHGRWTEGTAGRSFHAAGSLADSKVRKKAAFKDSQGEVWQEVAEKNARRGTENPTGTYRQVATGARVAAEVKPYEAQLGPALRGPGVVGVAVALNGRVIGLEQFASAPLFAKLAPKLLRSYAVSALDEPVAAAATAATAADVRAFASRIAGAHEDVVVRHEAAATTRQVGAGVVGSEVKAADAPAKAKPVYRSVMKDE